MKKAEMKEIFEWSSFDNDIHIGAQKTYKDYQYSNNESRSDYFKRWYKENKERHLSNVKAAQTRAAIGV